MDKGAKDKPKTKAPPTSKDKSGSNPKSKETPKKEEKKVNKIEEKKVEKKTDTKPGKKTEKKITKKDAKKVAKKDVKKTDKKEEKKTIEKSHSGRKTISQRLRGLSKQAAHAKRLKILKKKRYIKFTIDCAQQAADHIMKPRELERYLKNKIKVNNKTHNFGKKIRTKLSKNRVVVLARPPFTKRYLKYLSRRFLKKMRLRDWVRVVASGRNSYKLSYYKIESPEEEVEA